MGVFGRNLRGAFAVLTLLALALPALAKPTNTKITLINAGKVGSTQLKAGDYELIADESKVLFKLHGKVVAEAKAEWKDSERKTDMTSVVYDGDQIREIRFGGKKSYVVVR
jgi:hypothetical protein